MSDVTGAGDSFYTNELIDNVLVSRDGVCQAAAQYYAAGHDMKDPLISPVYGDMGGQSHAHYLRDDSAPETKEAFAEISDFFDKHMAK